MKFYDEIGKIALGSRIRHLSDKIGTDAAEIYRTYETNLNPKWFPVFYVLSKNEKSTVTAIAGHIGHSHASVSKIISEMAKAGLVQERVDAKDRRSTILGLSRKGKEVASKLESQYQDVRLAIEDLSTQATHNLWEALQEWEYLLDRKSLYERVLEMKRTRESGAVKIEPFQPKYKKAFRTLNEEWIKTYFKMEEPDYQALDNPNKYILDRGGFIFVATVDRVPVGVCALIWREDLKTYELAKMAVSEKERGKNIGFLLGKAAIEKAKSLNARSVYLESNTILKPAIRLYEKLGFKKIVGPSTPYERCNIQMELQIK